MGSVRRANGYHPVSTGAPRRAAFGSQKSVNVLNSHAERACQLSVISAVELRQQLHPKRVPGVRSWALEDIELLPAPVSEKLVGKLQPGRL